MNINRTQAKGQTLEQEKLGRSLVIHECKEIKDESITCLHEHVNSIGVHKPIWFLADIM